MDLQVNASTPGLASRTTERKAGQLKTTSKLCTTNPTVLCEGRSSSTHLDLHFTSSARRACLNKKSNDMYSTSSKAVFVVHWTRDMHLRGRRAPGRFFNILEDFPPSLKRHAAVLLAIILWTAEERKAYRERGRERERERERDRDRERVWVSDKESLRVKGEDEGRERERPRHTKERNS